MAILAWSDIPLDQVNGDWAALDSILAAAGALPHQSTERQENR